MYVARYRTSQRHTGTTRYTAVAVFMELPALGQTRVWPLHAPTMQAGVRQLRAEDVRADHVDTWRALEFQRLIESLAGVESRPLCAKKNYSEQHTISDEEAMASAYRLSYRGARRGNMASRTGSPSCETVRDDPDVDDADPDGEVHDD